MPNPQARRDGDIPPNQFGVVIDGSDADVTVISQGVDQSLVNDPPADSTVDTGDTTQAEPKQPSPELLAKRQEAAKHGWQNEQEWTESGKDQTRWRDAPDYLDVHDRTRAIAREENATLRQEVAALKAIVRARDLKEKQDLTQIGIAQLRTQRREAMRNENWDEVDALDQKILDATLAERDVRRAASAPADIDPVVQEQFNAIADKNPWMKQGTPQFDPVMVSRLMGEIKVIVETPGNPFGPIDAVREGLDRVRRRYPEKFNAPPRRTNGSSMVDMGGSHGINGSGSHGKTWNDLLPENRKIAEDDIRRGKYTKETYLSFAQPEDFRQ